VLCEPVTGRSHQLRLHLQRIGHPICNDPLYGRTEGALPVLTGAKRQLPRGEPADADELWLHAWSYSCDNGPRRFAIETPPPCWCLPFGPLPSLSTIDEADAPVPLESVAGRALLSECEASDRAAFDRLWPQYAQQRGRTMCGPASVAIVLRATLAASNCNARGAAFNDAGPPSATKRDESKAPLLRVAHTVAACASGSKEGSPPITPTAGLAICEGDACERLISEESVLRAQCAIPVPAVLSSGMTLEGMGKVLESLGAPCEVMHARGTSSAGGPYARAEAEMAAARDGLLRLRDALVTSDAVLLNYHMGTAGQRPFGGHFSPLAAYHQGSGRWLVLDVWPETQPCWLSGDLLWAAIASTDSESSLSRGWVSVSCLKTAGGSTMESTAQS
jgi:hypothetical protein